MARSCRYELIVRLRDLHAADPRFVFVPFEQWIKDPLMTLRRVCTALDLPLATDDPHIHPNVEERPTEEDVRRRRAKAIRMLRLDWEARWRAIFERLDFDSTEVFAEAAAPADGARRDGTDLHGTTCNATNLRWPAVN